MLVQLKLHQSKKSLSKIDLSNILEMGSFAYFWKSGVIDFNFLGPSRFVSNEVSFDLRNNGFGTLDFIEKV